MFMGLTACAGWLVALYKRVHIITSDMQSLVWGEPELAHEYDFDVENIE